jgi:hypothetical protein
MAYGEGPCPPEEFKRLLHERTKWGVAAWCFGTFGVALLGWGLFESSYEIRPSPPGRDAWIRLLLLSGLFFYCWSLAFYARFKERSLAWGLLGLGCLPGLIALRFMPSLCGWCGRTDRAGKLHCASCGGPV